MSDLGTQRVQCTRRDAKEYASESERNLDKGSDLISKITIITCTVYMYAKRMGFSGRSRRKCILN